MSVTKMASVDFVSQFQGIFQQAKGDDIALLGFIAAASVLYSLRGTLWDKKDPYDHLWYEKPQTTDGTLRKAETRNIARKLEETNKKLVIFWGSQSGTAEGLANRLSRDCHRRFGLDVLVADLQDYDPESISEIPESKLAIFIISTYGEGDPSDNTTQFYSWLHRTDQQIQFKTLRYVAFGLGNSKYQFYNRVIDNVTEALDSLCAKALLPTGKGDDAEGATEEDFMEWKESLFKLFKEHLGYEERPEIYEPALRVVEDPSLDQIDLHTGDPIPAKTVKKSASTSSSIRPMPIKSIRKLLDLSERNCLHAELDISEFPELKYKTGDHLAVWPINPIEEVDRLIRVLGLEEKRSTPLLISSIEAGVPCKIPSPTSLEALFQYYLEICGPVARETVLLLAASATSPAAKELLLELGSDKDRYSTYCLENHITFGRLLENTISTTSAETWNLPLSFVLENIPLLTPRKYSISSSSITQPKLISLTISTTNPTTATIPISIPGLTTSYLTSICEGLTSESFPSIPTESEPKLHASIHSSKFRLPVLPSTPLILIASGSGIAPFRAFLHERARLSSLGKPIGEMILLFGCRSQSDYLYSTEFSNLSSQLPTLKIITAFSREQVNGEDGGRMYVQHRMEENMTEIVDLVMEKGAHVYLCGSAAMARDVNGVFGRGVMGVKGWDEGGLREWSEVAKKRGKWLEDVWG